MTGTAPPRLQVGETPEAHELAEAYVNARDLANLERLTTAAPTRMLDPAHLGVLELHTSP